MDQRRVYGIVLLIILGMWLWYGTFTTLIVIGLVTVSYGLGKANSSTVDKDSTLSIQPPKIL